MGRRSISSTKTGKFMNPTDQARKEARRKELKKNKKQRALVREAVIKSKDPSHLITEIEQLDRMEFDPNNPPPYSVKVIQDKRKKLKETWQKVYKFHEREDPKLASELKSLEIEYEKRLSQIMSIYESVKKAEKVKLDDIPLPDAPSNQAALALYQTIDIPLPSQPSIPSITTQKGILKSKNDSKKKPPGPPPGPPPPLTEFECDDDEKELGLSADDNLSNVLNKAKKLRFADDNKLVSSTTATKPSYTPQIAPPPLPTMQSVMPSAVYGAASSSIRPPVPGYPVGKPMSAYGTSNYPSSMTAQRMPSSFAAAAQKYPSNSIASQSVLSAPPTRTTATSLSGSLSESTSTTIEAKPVLRNKMAEITRFVPSSVMIKRDQKSSKTSSKSDDTYSYSHYASSYGSNTNVEAPQKISTDAAYEAFMKEINKFL